MNPAKYDRRSFMKSVAAITAVASYGDHRVSRAELRGASRPIRLGAPVFAAPQDPEELALAHRKLGLRAAYCPAVPLRDTQRIQEISRAFAKHDVVIAEVGRWKNLLDADPAARKENRAFVTEGLALADEIGALCCVDIAGSYSKEIWMGPHPDNLSKKHFDESVENARAIIDAVKPKRAKFSFEMMGWAFPDSPDIYLKMIKAVDRDAFAVHLDPANLINSPRRFYNNRALLNECFDKLGPWIVSCHAKDVAWDVEMQIHFREVVLGTGKLDYTTYLRRLAALPNDVPLMIEHMKDAEEYNRCRQYLVELGQHLKIRFN